MINELIEMLLMHTQRLLQDSVM